MADTTLRQLPSDLDLTPLAHGGLGTSRPLMDWLTTFHLASVVLDPYTNESSWILRSATRILEHFREADVRTNFIVTAGPADARAFLGPLTDSHLVFCDPDRAAVKALAIEQTPAFVLVRVDGVLAASAEGWHAHEWHAVAERITELTHWSMPTIPGPDDPGPFDGTPALG